MSHKAFSALKDAEGTLREDQFPVGKASSGFSTYVPKYISLLVATSGMRCRANLTLHHFLSHTLGDL